MKILHISISDSKGGAARAAFRIHQGLIEAGIDSCMLVKDKFTEDPNIHEVMQIGLTGSIRSLLYRFQKRIAEYRGDKWITANDVLHTFGMYGLPGVIQFINASDADVINLHWIGNMLSLKQIAKIKKPIVWSLHDMWPFCGGEHYCPPESCARYIEGYKHHNRPVYESGPDLNKITWESKWKCWSHLNIHLVGVSNWVRFCSESSKIFKHRQHRRIAIPLDLINTWRPIKKSVAREALGLTQSKRYLIMGAVGGVGDPRKGADLLCEALKLAPQKNNIELLIYGQSKFSDYGSWPLPVRNLGNITDDRVLALANSAADLAIVPSRQEVFGQTALEAHACGLPVVAFNVGGLPDIVDHGETGWLANAFNIGSLAHGIYFLLNDEITRSKFSIRARAKAEEMANSEKITSQYIDLYNEVINGA
jgi:glycosyltransferase involved in cell wall biosynthesis